MALYLDLRAQPEAGNVGESATERYGKSAKEAVNFVSRGAAYLANAAKRTVMGDGLADETQNPAGEVTATRCARKQRPVIASGCCDGLRTLIITSVMCYCPGHAGCSCAFVPISSVAAPASTLLECLLWPQAHGRQAVVCGSDPPCPAVRRQQ